MENVKLKRCTLFRHVLLPLALASGCSGGQTGDLSGEAGHRGGPTSSDGSCDDQTTNIKLDDASALGFDADSVLSFAAQSFHSSIAWLPIAGATYSPGASPSTLTLTLTLTSLGTAQVVHSTPPKPSQDMGALIAYNCPPDRLRIAVHAQLTSDDGALLESFDDSIEAVDGHFALLRHALDLNELSGTLVVKPVVPASATEAQVKSLYLDALLAPGGIAGELSAQIVTSGKEVSSTGQLVLAHFPEDSTACESKPGDRPALPVAADNRALGFTGAEALARVNERKPLALSWDNGKGADLTLALSGLKTGCLEAANRVDSATPPATVTYPVIVQATTNDGKLQASYAANLITWPEPSGGFVERLDFSAQYELGALNQTGFQGVMVPSSAQRLGVSLQGRYDVTSVSGSIRLDSFIDPPCVSNPPQPMQAADGSSSSAGCQGTMVTPIVSGKW